MASAILEFISDRNWRRIAQRTASATRPKIFRSTNDWTRSCAPNLAVCGKKQRRESASHSSAGPHIVGEQFDRINQMTEAAKSAANRRENQPVQVESFKLIAFFRNKQVRWTISPARKMSVN